MRIQRKDELHLYYAYQTTGRIPIYETDSAGNIIYDIVDDVSVPRETGRFTQEYSKPIPFDGFITWDVSEAQARSFGLALGSYGAVLTVMKDQIDLKEAGLVFWSSTPDETRPAVEADADFRVGGIQPSLNFTRYVLQRNTMSSARPTGETGNT